MTMKEFSPERLISRRWLLSILSVTTLPAIISCKYSINNRLSDPNNWLDRVTAPDWDADSKAIDAFKNLAIHSNFEGVALSDDDRFIIFCRTFSPCNEIQFVDVENRTIRTIYHKNRLFKLFNPAFSHDGSRILLCISPPLYSGISNIISISTNNYECSKMLGGDPEFYHSPTYNHDETGIIFGFKTGPRMTPDDREIRNPAYRDGFFSRIGSLGSGGDKNTSFETHYSGLRSLSIIENGVVEFFSSGWFKFGAAFNEYRSVEAKFPELSRHSMILSFQLNEEGNPRLSFYPDRLISRIKQLNNEIGDSVLYRSSDPSGKKFYTAHDSKYNTQVLSYDGKTVEVSERINIGPNIDLGLNRRGSLAVVSMNDDRPGVGIVRRGKSVVVARSGELTRLPSQEISYSFVGPKFE